jgi:DNA-3-methyladenine glycosylase II
MMHIHGMNAHHQEFIAHLKRHDEILYDRVRSHGPITFPSVKPTPKSSFIALCRAIVGQQLSTKAAATIFLRLSEWAEANGGLTPSFILKHNAQEMRNVGLSPQKASYLLALSNAWNDNEDRFESLHTLSNEQVIASLTEIKGIGIWTAQMFLIFTLLRPDVFAPGDLGLKKAMERLYGISMASSESIFRAHAERWAPYRSLACMHLWKVLDSNESAEVAL